MDTTGEGVVVANNTDQRNLLRTLALTAIQETDIELVKFPNVPTLNITNGAQQDPSNEQWIRVTWLPGTAEFFSYGPPGTGKNTVIGICQIDIFTPKSQNDKDAWSVSDIISENMANQQLFEGAFQLDTLQCTVRPMEEEQNWYGVMCEVEFRAMHIR